MFRLAKPGRHFGRLTTDKRSLRIGTFLLSTRQKVFSTVQAGFYAIQARRRRCYKTRLNLLWYGGLLSTFTLCGVSVQQDGKPTQQHQYVPTTAPNYRVYLKGSETHVRQSVRVTGIKATRHNAVSVRYNAMFTRKEYRGYGKNVKIYRHTLSDSF